jgi:uncharacterized protein (DUF169 family)
MDLDLRDRFIEGWKRYFGGAELPITFYYADDPIDVERVRKPDRHRCIFADLNRVRQGKSIAFDTMAIGCFGGKRYLGFSAEIRPNFEYFLSCGIPGEMEGERYKKTPEMVREVMRTMPAFSAPSDWIVFKRWDHLVAADRPDVVIFYAKPDVLAGLFTLANFDEAGGGVVVAPFGSGCSSIVMQPYLLRTADPPRAVLGLFDPSARPYVAADILTFAVPMAKFERMVANMGESFLITETWKVIADRIGG